MSDYGIDGENLLLAEPNNTDDLLQIKQALTENGLRERLKKNARETAKIYNWETAMGAFLQTQWKIKREPLRHR